MEPKAALRRQLLEQRNNLDPAYVARSDAGILRSVTGMPEFAAAGTLFVYVSVAGEPDTREIIRTALAAGKRVCVPRITGKGTMCAVPLECEAALVPGPYGIPTAAGNGAPVSPEEFDLALIPCVSVTEGGIRLGYGGGYYDRYFSYLNGAEKRRLRTFVLVRERLISETLPKDEKDIVFDGIVTENRVKLFTETA